MTRIIMFTPTYVRSPGTQARINLIMKSLKISGFKTELVVSRESTLQRIYHKFGEELLVRKSVWNIMGYLISRDILKYGPDAAILFLDVSASAIPYLKREGIKTILSIEDLTPEYKNYREGTSEKFYQLLKKACEEVDAIICSGYTLAKRLKEIDLDAIPVPVGLEIYTRIEEAICRSSPPTIVHSGQLTLQRQIDIISELANKYTVMVHDFGILSGKLRNGRNIIKYRAKSPEEGARIVQPAHIGLIIEYKKTYSLNRLYFHTSLLQPIVAEGNGPWVEEARQLGVPLYRIESIEELFHNYEKYVKELSVIQRKLAIPFVHKPLLKLLESIL